MEMKFSDVHMPFQGRSDKLISSFSRMLFSRQNAEVPMQVGQEHEMLTTEKIAPIARLSLPLVRNFFSESFILTFLLTF